MTAYDIFEIVTIIVANFIGLLMAYNAGRRDRCTRCDTLRRLTDSENVVQSLNENIERMHNANLTSRK